MSDINNQEAVSNQVASGDMSTSSFVFLETEYVHGFKDATSAQEMHEFVPKGETVENWTKLITIIRDTSVKATKETLDSVAEATLADLKTKGAFVYNAFTYGDDPAGAFNVMTIVFPGNPAEVDIKKIYIDDNGYVVGNTYGIKIVGADDAEVSKKVNEYLETTKDIGMQFIRYSFPEIK